MTTPIVPHSPVEITIKELSDSGAALSSLPSCYVSRKPDLNPDLDLASDDQKEEIPIIDFSLVKGGTPDQQSGTIQELGRACGDWGCFMVVNHGVPMTLTKDLISAFEAFFDMTAEKKREQSGFGSGFNTTVEGVIYWRDYLKMIVHPEFDSSAAPPGLREILQEHTSSTREMCRELLRGIWESLNLEVSVMDGALELESCFQPLVANLYPPCPEPELAIGLPPHSDHGLLTILLQNGVDGLEIKHNGKWILVKPPLHAFLVITGDQMEIISNGRYESLLHRATVNSKSTRFSMATLIGPSLDAVVVPAPQLVSSEYSPARFRGIKYRDFMKLLLGNKLKEKYALNLLRLSAE